MSLKEKSQDIEKACKAYIDKKEEVLANRKIYLDEREQIMDNFLSYVCSVFELKKNTMQKILIIKE